MGDASNRPRAALWRRVVSDALVRLGFENARPRPERTLRQSIEEGVLPDVLGLPEQVYVHVHADLSPRWGSALDSVEMTSAMHDHAIGIVIQYRRPPAGPEQAFAVMSVEGLARLLHLAFPTAYPATLHEFETDLAVVLDADPHGPLHGGEDG